MIVCILHSSTKYTEEFGVEYHHAGGIVVLVRDHTENREPMLVLIQIGNPKTAQKETMVLKDDTKTW